MSNNLIVDFPILRNESVDFKDGVGYTTEAKHVAGRLEIKHTLTGRSFIRDLMESKSARFSVLLLFADSAERKSYVCEEISISENEITAEHSIKTGFSYAPEIKSSIIIMEDREFRVNDLSGLTDFWEQGESFFIPQYARIALAVKLKFTDGGMSKLMEIKPDANLGQGEMEVIVSDGVGEGQIPVTLQCGKDVYDELRKMTNVNPEHPIQSMRSAIITQALCAVYAYMQNRAKNEDYENSGVLLAHLKSLEATTGENWTYENFNPSLAATKMRPYFIEVFRYGADDD